MKKILIAMDNNVLLEKIKRCGKYAVHIYDIDTKEDVIEYLKKYNVDVLITKDFLNGNMSKEEYIRNIRALNQNMKIILCVEGLNEIYRGFLFSNNVFDVIEGTEASFSDILGMIDSVKNTIILRNNKNIVREELTNKSKLNVLTKQKICVFRNEPERASHI
ncbi:MAG: hypothetical protein IJ272_06365 [Clostridia bacterium]|nr:hypothetical protein [Clostridia bacterium]